MRSQTTYIIIFFLALSWSACVKYVSSSSAPVPDQSFTEEFDTVQSAFDRGWIRLNNSSPLGSGSWEQGGASYLLFPAYSSRSGPEGFIGVNYQSTAGGSGIVSNWLISPSLILQNGDEISFYTRCQLKSLNNGDSADFGNNLEVCINPYNDSLNIGGPAQDPRSSNYDLTKDRGDFRMIFQLNEPNYNPFSNLFEYRVAHSRAGLFDPLAYPSGWTRFVVRISGLRKPVHGRFAFRYYVLGAGSRGNGTGIGIDRVSYTSQPK